jgi:hypothetical protein
MPQIRQPFRSRLARPSLYYGEFPNGEGNRPRFALHVGPFSSLCLDQSHSLQIRMLFLPTMMWSCRQRRAVWQCR